MKKITIILLILMVFALFSILSQDSSLLTKNAFDVAELYSIEDETISAGDVVVLANTKYDSTTVAEVLDIDEAELKKSMEEEGINDFDKLEEYLESIGSNKSGKKETAGIKEKIKQKISSKGKEIESSTGQDKLLASKGVVVKLTNTESDPNIVGVVSSNPAFTMGFDSDIKEIKSVPVALLGRVPIKISLANGPISKGDPLTSSTRKGYAAKSLHSGRIIGYAMEDYNQESNNDKILVFVQPGWYNAGSEVQGQSQLSYLNKVNGSVIIRLG